MILPTEMHYAFSIAALLSVSTALPIHAQEVPNVRRFTDKHQERLNLVHGSPSDFIKAEQVISYELHGLKLFWSEELPRLVGYGSGSELIVSKECVTGYEKVVNATDEAHLPLLADMADAWGKLGAGILEGNRYAYGSYDQCLGENLLQYCMGTVNTTLSSFLSFQLAMCVPKGCTAEDLTTVINGIPIFVTNASTIFCISEQKLPYNAGAIIMIIVTGLFVVVVFGATIFDLSLMCMENSSKTEVQIQDKLLISDKTPLISKSATDRTKVYNLITAFSLYKTVPVVLSTKQPSAAITSINGLRVISMFWVMLGHTHFNWTFITAADNLKYIIFSVGRRFSYQALLNGFLSVDSFFFLSGLLVSYLTLRDMSRRKPGFKRFPILMYYIHRFLRLTPAYAFVLFGFWFLSPHLGNGPLYVQSTGDKSSQYENCAKYWWTNVLYINNLYPSKLADECMPWTWYLANDMQFYIVAPLMIIPLFIHFAFGLAVIAIFLVLNFTITASLTGAFNFQASQFAPYIYNYTEAEYTSNDLLYDKPYYRITPYLVGIFLGYLMYRKIRFTFGCYVNMTAYSLLWIITAGACMGSLYGLYPVVNNNPPSLTPHSVTNYIPSMAQNLFYITLSRFAWAVGLSLLVFCCHNGYGGWVSTFLSWQFWVPMSRLTFMAYLVNPIVLTSLYGSLRAPLHYNDTVLAVFTIGSTVLSFGAAFMLAVFVEFPLGNLEVAVFKLLGVSRRESARHEVEPLSRHCNESALPKS